MVITKVGVEGGLVCGGADGVVVCELSDGQLSGPVVVLGRHVGAQDLLKVAVSHFGLTISLRSDRLPHHL